MRTLPPEPKPGDKISATLIREIIRAIRERTVLQGPGVKTSVGPNGTVLSVDPSAKKTSAAILPQCFDLKTGDGETKLVRCYYSAGDMLKHVDDIELDEEFGYGFLCFRIDVSPASDDPPEWTETEYVSHFDTIEEMQEAQAHSSYVLVPLYKFEEAPEEGEEAVDPFKVVVDLRRAPRCNVFESLQDEETES